jgi:hypothetical protein
MQKSFWPRLKMSVIVAGLCEAVVRGLGVSKRVRMKVLSMTALFLNYLSEHLQPAALAVLVAGDVLELVVQELVEGGEAMHGIAVPLLVLFCTDPGPGERLCALPLVDTLMKWIEEWLLKVRKNIVALWGTRDGEYRGEVRFLSLHLRVLVGLSC